MECGGMVFACQQIFNVPVIRGRDTLVDLNIAILVGGKISNSRRYLSNCPLVVPVRHVHCIKTCTIPKIQICLLYLVIAMAFKV